MHLSARAHGNAARRGTATAAALAALLTLAGLALLSVPEATAQLRDDSSTSTLGTQFVRPPPRPAPPPQQPAEPPTPAQPEPAALEPPKEPEPPPKPPPRFPSAVILLDTSDSMLNRLEAGGERTRLDDAKDALVQVLREMPPETRVQLWTFNTRMTPVLVRGVARGQFVRIGVGGNREELVASVGKLHTSGGTNLYQSVVNALELFAEPGDQAAYMSGERYPVLIVISDGEDGGKTRVTLRRVQDAKARRPLVTVNAVGFQIGTDQALFETLCRIATQRDGCAAANDRAQLQRILGGFYRFRQQG